MAVLELARRRMRDSFSAFLRMFPPEKPFFRGRHTKDIIRRCERAIKKVEGGESQYLIINVPFRHGKSGVSSCRLPVWSLLRNPKWEHIIATYNYTLSAEMSIKARNCFIRAAPMYKRKISPVRNQIGSWKLELEDGKEDGGGVFATGIGGTITGRGADVLLIDDFYKGIEEAESETVRRRVRHNFESNLMTRLKPVHLVLIICNRWHIDDLVGWILRKNDPKSSDYDKKFPKFEVIKHQAWDDEKGWLFPECYSKEWYESIQGMVGSYAWNAQAQQEPAPRTGNLLDISKVNIVDLNTEAERAAWNEKPWQRAWDLASSEKERMKEDPDFTVGTKACFVDNCLYVDDVVWGQWEATKREKMFIEVAVGDGYMVAVVVEVVAGYKDAYTRVRDLLNPKGVVVKPFYPSGTGDKVARASCIEPAFELGRVFIKRAAWNERFLAEQGMFPSGQHDDFTDSLVIAVYDQAHRGGGSFELQ